ncbi:PSA2 [Symbiodinium sp. CCMP2592]|nr:PSA2 [Symbiodinium sp. CCMP2592]
MAIQNQAFVLPSAQPAPPLARLSSKSVRAEHGISERGALLAMAAATVTTITSSRRRVARRATEEPQNYFEAVVLSATRIQQRVALRAKEDAHGRRSSLAAAATAAAATPLAASAESDENCHECEGRGLVECPMCEGTGQYRLWGTKYEKTSQRQYLTCPECNGVGELVCQKCSGTGLPASKLKGLMRDPIFAKVAYRLKKQRIDVNTVDKMRVDVRKAVAAAERRHSSASFV